MPTLEKKWQPICSLTQYRDKNYDQSVTDVDVDKFVKECKYLSDYDSKIFIPNKDKEAGKAMKVFTGFLMTSKYVKA